MNYSVQLIKPTKDINFKSLKPKDLNEDLKSELYSFMANHEGFLINREHKSQGVIQDDIDNETDAFFDSFGVQELLYDDIHGFLETDKNLGPFDDKKPINEDTFEFYIKELCFRTDSLIIFNGGESRLNWPNFISKYVDPLYPEYLDENFKEIEFEEFYEKSLSIKHKYGYSLSSLICYRNE